MPGLQQVDKTKEDEMREKIMRLESVMLQMKGLQIELPIKHYFQDGVYLREMFIPKGVTLTGRIHKTEHHCILSQGEVSVYTESGMKRLKASTVVHSMPGIKRALYAHEDSVWINVHTNPTNERDEEKIWDIFTADTFEEALPHLNKKEIEGGK